MTKCLQVTQITNYSAFKLHNKLQALPTKKSQMTNCAWNKNTFLTSFHQAENKSEQTSSTTIFPLSCLDKMLSATPFNFFRLFHSSDWASFLPLHNGRCFSQRNLNCDPFSAQIQQRNVIACFSQRENIFHVKSAFLRQKKISWYKISILPLSIFTNWFFLSLSQNETPVNRQKKIAENSFMEAWI